MEITTTAGRYTSSLTSEGSREGNVTFSQLAEGKTFEDFLDHLETHMMRGDREGYPAVALDEDSNPRVHPWMEGTWREIHQAGAGETHAIEALTLIAGNFVAFCFTAGDEPNTAHVWPATGLTVEK